jgi:hypothetical protein
MVPMLGNAIEPIPHKPPTDVIPMQDVLDEFHKRCGIPAKYLGRQERTIDSLKRIG